MAGTQQYSQITVTPDYFSNRLFKITRCFSHKIFETQTKKDIDNIEEYRAAIKYLPNTFLLKELLFYLLLKYRERHCSTAALCINIMQAGVEKFFNFLPVTKHHLIKPNIIGCVLKPQTAL